MEQLPAQLMSATPHLVFSIFNFAIPNILAWVIVLGAVLVTSWLRLPKIFERD